MLAMEDAAIAPEISRLLHSGRELSNAEAQQIVDLVRASRGPERALERARELSSEARRQLESLSAGQAGGALAALTNYVVSRKL
jgi:hypothetical protein